MKDRKLQSNKFGRIRVKNLFIPVVVHLNYKLSGEYIQPESRCKIRINLRKYFGVGLKV